MRPVTEDEVASGHEGLANIGISVSAADSDNYSPKLGDMIARNPNNHADQWLVAKQYFEDNLELVQ